MLPSTPREGAMIILYMSLSALLVMCSPTLAPAVPEAAFLVAGTLVLVAAAALGYMKIAEPRPEPVLVDVWRYQEHLMRISHQALPELPEMNKDVVMYYALALEELAETGQALAISVQRHMDPASMEVSLITDLISDTEKGMEHASKRLRRVLSTLDHTPVPMPRAEAKTLLDGITDVAVVTAGMGLAAGLPVRDGYVEVMTSNLSKANPDTGLIDKEPSGKWIKGSEYREPDLVRVLEDQHRAVFYYKED